MFSVLVIRLRSLRLLRVSGIVMRLRMFLLLITFLKASHSFRNRLLRSEERLSRNAETDLVCRLLLEKKNEEIGVGDPDHLLEHGSGSYIQQTARITQRFPHMV